MGQMENENITILHMCAYNNNTRASEYMNQKLTNCKKNQTNLQFQSNFNTLLSVINRPRNHKISEDTLEVNNTINQIDPIDIFRTLHPITTKYIFFSSAREVFTRVDHILGHKKSLNEFKTVKSYQVYSLKKWSQITHQQPKDLWKSSNI